jgi:PhzF family phenazine biosynthesis protein
MKPDVDLVSVFTFEGSGGNPCPIVVDGRELAPQDMQAVAREHGHESGFVLPPANQDYDLSLRFWVPNHEMEMCGHATIGALWLLASKGSLPGDAIRIETRSGPVTGFVRRDAAGKPSVEITQPAGRVAGLTEAQTQDVLGVLGLGRDDLLDLPIQNAVTSRVKTLVPIKDVDRLNALKSDMTAVEAVCHRIGSTGLYPYAVQDRRAQAFEARQFPPVLRLSRGRGHGHCRGRAVVRPAGQRPRRCERQAHQDLPGARHGRPVGNRRTPGICRRPRHRLPAGRRRRAAGARGLAGFLTAGRNGWKDLAGNGDRDPCQ